MVDVAGFRPNHYCPGCSQPVETLGAFVMLLAIKGTELKNPIWSAFSIERVLKYYDGPRLLLQKTLAGQLYLAWWSDSDDSTERWIYLPLSEHRLREILSGEMPSLDALKAPEDGSLLVVDKDLNTDSIIKTVLTDAAALPGDALPRPGASLNVPMPSEISGLASRDGAHRLDLKIEAAGLTQNGQVAAEVVSRVIGNVQRLLDAIGHAMSETPSSRGPVPNNIRQRTQLNLVGTYAGSLGLRLETNREDNLSGESLVRSSLEGLFNLLEDGRQASEPTLQRTVLSPRVAANYHNFLSTIETSRCTASLGWNRPREAELREFTISPEWAKSTKTRIESATKEIQEELSLDGRFIAGNTRTLRFTFRTPKTEEPLSVSVPREVYRRVGHITLGSPYRIVLQPNLQVNAITGEEKTTYTLLEFGEDWQP